MTAPILVTGATGNVGGAVVRLLCDAGHLARAANRSATRVDSRAQAVPFDFTDPTTYDAAFDDVECMFLVRPPALANVQRDIVPALLAAQAQGVRHVVFLSLQGVEDVSFVPHAKIEAWLRESGLTWTFLRAGFFMQNLSTTHAADIREADTILIPAGDARTSFIDVRDIAAVAVEALAQPGAHTNAAYTLTGDAALTYHEVATVMSSVLGRSIVYPRPSLWRFAQSMHRRGYELMPIIVMCLLYLNTRRGMAAAVSDDAERLLGRAPRSITTFVEDHVAVWAAKP